MSRLTDLTGSLLETPLVETPSLVSLRQRADHRRRARRRHGLIAVASAIVVASLAGTTIHLIGPKALTTPSLSAQVTAFDTPGPAHLLNKEVTLSPLFNGWKLISDRQTNVITRPANYSRSITYANTSTSGSASLTVTINQGVINPDFVTPPPGGIANASTQTVTVDGHPALLLQVSDQNTSVIPTKAANGTQSITIVGDVCTNTNTSAGTNHPSTCAATAGPVHLGSPDSPAPTPSSGRIRQLVLQWKLSPLLGVQVVGSGLSVPEIEALASGLAIRPKLDNCMPGGHPIQTGQCAPGVVASPPITTPQIPIGGTELAYGTVAHQPWVLSASEGPGGPWMELVYANAVVTSSGSSLPMNTVNWDNASNGETFFSGSVPSWVTSLTVSGPSKQRTALLPTVLNGWRFFILPMGIATTSCKAVCYEPITATFYDGTNVVGHVRLMTTESSFGGFKLDQPS